MANIVWDIDGVLIDLEKYLLKKAPKFFKNKFDLDLVNTNTIYLTEMFNCTEEQEEMFWKHNLNLLTYTLSEKVYFGMKEVMDKIHEDGDKNIICTARGKCEENSIVGKIMRYAVSNWITRNNLRVDDIYYVSHKNSAEEKLAVCKKVNATVLIDDDLSNIEKISKEIPTILFSNNYNKEIKDNNICIANCGDDIYLNILKIKQQPDVQDFKFLTREEREQLNYEELVEYYNKYRCVMKKMPYNHKKRDQQEKKYKKLYKLMDKIHSITSSKTILLNNEMIEKLKSDYKGGKIFIFGSHTTLDDIQQVEKAIDDMAFFLVKNEFSKYPIIGKFLESIGCEYVERQNADSRIYSRKQLEKIVLHGKNVIMSPEGTRNKTTNKTGKFELGAASIAQRTGSYLIPIALKRYDEDNKVYVKICEPRIIGIDDDIEKATSELQQEITNEIIEIENNVEKNKQKTKKRYFNK